MAHTDSSIKPYLWQPQVIDMQIRQAVCIRAIVFGPAVQCIKLPRSVTTETIYTITGYCLSPQTSLPLCLYPIFPPPSFLPPLSIFLSSFGILGLCRKSFILQKIRKYIHYDCVSSNKCCESLHCRSLWCIRQGLKNKRHSAIQCIWDEQA